MQPVDERRHTGGQLSTAKLMYPICFLMKHIEKDKIFTIPGTAILRFIVGHYMENHKWKLLKVL